MKSCVYLRVWPTLYSFWFQSCLIGFVCASTLFIRIRVLYCYEFLSFRVKDRTGIDFDLHVRGRSLIPRRLAAWIARVEKEEIV